MIIENGKVICVCYFHSSFPPLSHWKQWYWHSCLFTFRIWFPTVWLRSDKLCLDNTLQSSRDSPRIPSKECILSLGGSNGSLWPVKHHCLKDLFVIHFRSQFGTELWTRSPHSLHLIFLPSLIPKYASYMFLVFFPLHIHYLRTKDRDGKRQV